MKIIVTIILITITSAVGYYLYDSRDSKITSDYCHNKGGKVVNTLNYLIDGEELTAVPGSYVQVVDPLLLEKSIGEVEGMKCPSVCIVE